MSGSNNRPFSVEPYSITTHQHPFLFDRHIARLREAALRREDQIIEYAKRIDQLLDKIARKKSKGNCIKANQDDDKLTRQRYMPEEL